MPQILSLTADIGPLQDEYQSTSTGEKRTVNPSKSRIETAYDRNPNGISDIAMIEREILDEEKKIARQKKIRLDELTEKDKIKARIEARGYASNAEEN
jgi:hypothetical protein